MKSIVRLKWCNKLEVQESIDIITHKNTYDVKFKASTGHIETDFSISKNLYNNEPYEEMGTWENRLYVSGTKYHENPNYWINLVKTWRKQNDLRKWLKYN